VQGLELFPAVSVAVQVTVVVPSGKSEPLAGSQATVTPGQLSIAAVVKVTFVPHNAGFLAAAILSGQVLTVGGSLSFTVTVKLHVAVWLEVSVAVQVTVVVPLLKAVPLAGVQLTLTPGQLSLPVGVV
jgi:hypothetical protein